MLNFVKYKQYHTTPSIDSVSPVLSVFLKSCLTKSCIYQGVCEHKHEESGLMPFLIGSIRLADVVATTRCLKTKIPIEHNLAEGPIVHPSDFVVPRLSHTCASNVTRTKEREQNKSKDHLVQTATVTHSVLKSGLEQFNTTTLPVPHKVPFKVHEPDNTVKHSSGFMPSTPAPSHAVLRVMHTASTPKSSEDT